MDWGSIGSLFSSMLSPNEANAEVIPEDIRTRELIQQLLKQGGQGASTYRMAHMLPDKVNVAASQPKWDENIKEQIEFFYPNAKNKQELKRRGDSNIGGTYNGDASQITVNPKERHPMSFFGDYSKTLGHELGHFLTDKLDFKTDLKHNIVSEEEFADFLGGIKRNRSVAREQLIRQLASEMFKKAITK